MTLLGAELTKISVYNGSVLNVALRDPELGAPENPNDPCKIWPQGPMEPLPQDLTFYYVFQWKDPTNMLRLMNMHVVRVQSPPHKMT